MFTIEDFERKLFDVETGGEGAGAPASGGTLIGDAGEAGAEGEGNPGETAEAAPDAGGEGTTEEPEQEAAEGDKTEEGSDDEPKGAPEQYEEFKVPEGYTVDDKALEEFVEFAKGRDMTQDQAQEILDYYTKNLETMFSQQAEAWENTRKEWVESARSDKEFGGQRFQENLKHVSSAMKQFGTPELRQVLNDSGLGDNPELIRFFYRVGKLAGEGEFHTGSGGSAGERDAAKTLYPDMN